VIDMDWRHRAACLDEDPELFFPVSTTGAALDQIAAAKSVCHRCPVTGACLAWALRTGQRAGVWGGLCEGERDQLRQGRPAADNSAFLLTIRARTAVPLRGSAGARRRGDRFS
jgi:WhiB family redox-sensing transcriptional regulator